VNPEILITEARARITWGDEPASVRDFLTSSGMSAADADAKIKELICERSAEIRKIGIRNVVIGAAILCAAAFGFFVSFACSPSGNLGPLTGRVCVAAVLAALFGLWKLTKGVIDLVWPKSERGSIPDITE
jgi:hypothetical protein